MINESRLELRRSIQINILFALGVLYLITPANAQGFRGPSYAVVNASASPAVIRPGAIGKLTINIAILSGFHINSAKPLDPNLIATSFSSNPASGIKFLSPKYPQGRMIKTAGSPQPISAYTGLVRIVVPFSVKLLAKHGKAAIGGTLTVQGCNAVACFPPKQDPVSTVVTIK